MGRYWREASDLFFRRPLLWVPVVVGDLCCALLNVGQQAWVRSVALGQMQYHSVLGGTVQQRGLTIQAAQQVYIQMTAIAWTSYLVRTLIYASAFVLTAALVWEGERRERIPKTFAALKERFDGTMYLALRALAVFAFASVGNTYLLRYLKLHRSPLLTHVWFQVLLSVIVIGLLVYVLTGPALRLLLTPIRVTEHVARSGRVMGLLLGLASLGLGYFAGQSSMAMRHATEGNRAVLEVMSSLLTAVPYILMFIGFGVITQIQRTAAEDGE
jgi:hypothetical protein